MTKIGQIGTKEQTGSSGDRTDEDCPECMDSNTVDARVCGKCGIVWSVAEIRREIQRLQKIIDHKEVQ